MRLTLSLLYGGFPCRSDLVGWEGGKSQILSSGNLSGWDYPGRALPSPWHPAPAAAGCGRGADGRGTASPGAGPTGARRAGGAGAGCTDWRPRSHRRLLDRASDAAGCPRRCNQARRSMCAPPSPARAAATGVPGLPTLPLLFPPLLLLVVASPTGQAGRRIAPAP